MEAPADTKAVWRLAERDERPRNADDPRLWLVNVVGVNVVGAVVR
jgi:hypothetical protein